MSEAVAQAAPQPRGLGAAILLGGYAALLALAPDFRFVLAGLAPLLLVPLAYWTLAGPNRWAPVFLCSAVLLPPLPIALGNSGPHVCLIPAALGLAAGALGLRDWRIPADGLSRAILTLFFLLLASAGLAALYSGLPIALESLARVMLFGISCYLFFYVTRGPWRPAPGSEWKMARTLFLAGAASAAFACVDFYFQFPAPAGFGPQYVWLDTGVFRRAQGLFYEASTLGNFCAFFLVMTAVALTRPKRHFPLPRPALLTGAAIFSVALALSFSRASLLNVVAALAALGWLNRGRLRVRRPGAAWLLAIAAGGGLAYYLLPAFLDLYWSRLSSSATYLFSATEGVLSGRLSSWSTLADFLRENPLCALAGIGYKTLPYTNLIGEAVVGDNMYLTMLVETGVAGLAALVWLNAAIVRTAYRAARSEDGSASFFGTWIFCFWVGEMFQMMSGDLLTYWRVLPFYFFVLALAARAADEHPAS